MSGWQTGQIFFCHLLQLMNLPLSHLETTRTLKGWLSLFRKSQHMIIGSRKKLSVIRDKPNGLTLEIITPGDSTLQTKLSTLELIVDS